MKGLEEKIKEEQFSDKFRTGVYQEIPLADKPYATEEIYCYGYAMEDIANGASFADYLLLMMRGEFGSKRQAKLMEQCLIKLSVIGIRHEATRAVVTAAVGKTVAENLLPIGQLVITGKEGGVGDISNTMNLLRQAASTIDQQTKLDSVIDSLEYGVGPYLRKTLESFHEQFGGDYLRCLLDILLREDTTETKASPTYVAIVSAVFLELEINPLTAIGLAQLLVAGPLITQAAEHMKSSLQVLPFVPDDKYQIAGE